MSCLRRLRLLLWAHPARAPSSKTRLVMSRYDIAHSDTRPGLTAGRRPNTTPQWGADEWARQQTNKHAERLGIPLVRPYFIHPGRRT
ncbi:hypothetical protein C8Q70DRAFT_984895 [Cubamyces menziesii]|nr:hypothetical protein C8Q70DRAFT_984895 [Cubamyces menziesii]